MLRVIPYGVKVLSPRNRGPSLGDAVSRSTYKLYYGKIGAFAYFVYQGRIVPGRALGTLVHFPGMPLWLYSPNRDGYRNRIYLAPTRFEAVNAFHHFIEFVE